MPFRPVRTGTPTLESGVGLSPLSKEIDGSPANNGEVASGSVADKKHVPAANGHA